MSDAPLCPVRITDREGNVIGFVHDSDLRKAIKEAVMVNRYRVDLNHPDSRGVDFEVLADDEATALEAGLAGAPAGAYAERVVPMEIDVQLPPDPPITRAEGEDDSAYGARVAARAEADEAARVAAAERRAAVARGETPAAVDLPPLPVPEWPALTEAEAAAWEVKKAAAEAAAAAVPAFEHEHVEEHEPTRAEARAAAKAEAKAERAAEREDHRRR